MVKHAEHSLRILNHLEGWGFPDDVQRRLGALAVLWSVFETTLESTVWALNGEKVAGVRPSTDKASVSDWIDELGKLRGRLSLDAERLLGIASLAARDLMDYRHGIFHGWMMPSSTMPRFIRNPAWSGEVRRRPSHDAHLDANLLDMALESAWTLCQVVNATRNCCIDGAKTGALLALADDVARAQSLAHELRHLTAMVNHDKY